MMKKINFNPVINNNVQKEVIYNICLIQCKCRILYICDIKNIFAETPKIPKLVFNLINGKWFIYLRKNKNLIFPSNDLLIGVALNYIEPSFMLDDKSYILVYYVKKNIILYSQRITSLRKNIKKIEDDRIKYSRALKTNVKFYTICMKRLL